MTLQRLDPQAVVVAGIGNMGWPIAQRLRRAGLAPLVWDVDKARRALALEAGMAVAQHAADAVRRAREAMGAQSPVLLIVVVVDAQQLDELLWGQYGAAAAMRTGDAVMLCPTIAPEDTERVAARLGAQGVGVIDAPMSGGPARALEGSMSLMVAGPDALLKQHEALLHTLSSRLFMLGSRIGDGARTKLVNNLLAATNLAAAAEALHLASALGLDAARMQSVIDESSGASWIGTDRMGRALRGDESPRAHMTLLGKDSRLALQAARHVQRSPELGAVAARWFSQACEQGFDTLDDSALWRWLRERDHTEQGPQGTEPG